MGHHVPDGVPGALRDALSIESETMAIPPTRQNKRTERQTGLSLLLGICIWFLYLNTAYALASLSCQLGWLSFHIAGMSGLQFVETLIVVVAIMLMLVTIYLPWRDWR